MTTTAPRETFFSPSSEIVRRRLLPIPGEVLVHVGDRVQADDIVAKTKLPGGLHVIDLAQALKVSVHKVRRYVCVQEGQEIAKGDLLAAIRYLGLTRRAVRAPFAGTVQRVDEGYLFLRRHPQNYLLRAYLPGRVIEEYPHQGVAIRTIGALIRGIWGSGGETQGILVTMVDGPNKPLTWRQVSLRYRGTILVGGTLADPRVLLRARQFHLHGLVLGSIAPQLRSLCERISLPVIVTEGMGYIPMAEPIFALLRSLHGHIAVLSGRGEGQDNGPELIIPLPSQEASEEKSPAWEKGVLVRITRPPFLGLVGEIVSLPPAPQETSIGIEAEGAEVRLPDGRRLFVPFVNLELLGKAPSQEKSPPPSPTNTPADR